MWNFSDDLLFLFSETEIVELTDKFGCGSGISSKYFALCIFSGAATLSQGPIRMSEYVHFTFGILSESMIFK